MLRGKGADIETQTVVSVLLYMGLYYLTFYFSMYPPRIS